MKRNGLSHEEAGKLGAIASQAYQEKYKQSNLIKYYNEPKSCKQCQVVITYENRVNMFCSQTCAAVYNNAQKPKTHYYCAGCNEEIISENRYARKYCSNKCQKQSEWNEHKKQIEAVNNAPHVHSAKRYLKDKFGCICQICQSTTWANQPIPLVLDHIDGNSENNTLSNLRLVCGNCDMQLPTYKGKNRGNGRHARRQRRAEGKSY